MKIGVVIPVAEERVRSFPFVLDSIDQARANLTREHTVQVFSKIDVDRRGAGFVRRSLMNRARLAGMDILVSLDDDMEVMPEFFNAIVKTVEKQPDVFLFSATMDTYGVKTYGSLITIKDDVIERKELTEPGEMNWMPTGTMVLAGHAATNFEFNFPPISLGEDLMMFFQAQKFGYETVKNIPGALVKHKPYGTELHPPVAGFRSPKNYDLLETKLMVETGKRYRNIMRLEKIGDAIKSRYETQFTGKHYHSIYKDRASFLASLETPLQSESEHIGERPSNDRWQVIKEYLQAGESILDIGCNIGYFTHAAQAMGLRAVGVDSELHIEKVHLTNESPIDRARILNDRYGLYPVFVKNDAVSFLKDCVRSNIEFDVIMALSILHHIDNWQEAIALMADRGKSVIIEYPQHTFTPNEEDFLGELRKYFNVSQIGSSSNGWEGTRPIVLGTRKVVR